MGGGTTKVGDPSFRADERPLLSNKQIEENISGIKGVFSNYLDFGEKPSDALMIIKPKIRMQTSNGRFGSNGKHNKWHGIITT